MSEGTVHAVQRSCGTALMAYLSCFLTVLLLLFSSPSTAPLPFFSQDSIDQKRAEEYLDELLLSSSDPSNPLSASAGRTPSSSSGRGRGGSGGSEEEEEEVEERPLSSASSVSRKRAEWAMAKMYETDAEFRQSVDALIPGVSMRLLACPWDRTGRAPAPASPRGTLIIA